MVRGQESSSRSVAVRALLLLSVPLCASATLGGLAVAAAAAAGAPVDGRTALLALLGPSIPIYLLLLPLFPFAIRALRRGWAPRPVSVLGWTLLASLALDSVYWIARS